MTTNKLATYKVELIFDVDLDNPPEKWDWATLLGSYDVRYINVWEVK